MARAQTSKTVKTARTRGSALLGALMVLGLLALMAMPALAHHKDDHEQGNGSHNEENYQQADQQASESSNSDHDGDADSSSTAYAEDNDTNDGGIENNVADEGDNAHPSGKDRSVENGKSGDQGKSESNPDDSKGPMRYEGAPGDDKPNGPGGTDLADQDGNNGCGNDDDFDDDNNGWCGRKPKKSEAPALDVAPTVETKVCPTGTDKAGQPMTDEKDCNEDEVLGRTDDDEPKDDVLGRTDDAEPKDDVLGRTDDAEPKDDVLGEFLHRAIPQVAAAPAATLGEVLPFTGGAILVYVFAALGLIAAGTVALRAKN